MSRFMTTTTEDLMREAEALRDQAPQAKNSLHITDATGDTRIMWDPANKDETDAAKAAFDAAKAKKMLAYKVDDNGKRTGEVITRFDKKAGKIIMVRQPQGG